MKENETWSISGKITKASGLGVRKKPRVAHWMREWLCTKFLERKLSQPKQTWVLEGKSAFVLVSINPRDNYSDLN